DKLGDLGGATDAGASGWDEEHVAALPPRADKAGN
ncbi:ferredoxin, partial [Bifidobacteriaceae bacterium NR003]